MKCQKYLDKILKSRDNNINKVNIKEIGNILQSFDVPPECYHKIITYFLINKTKESKKNKDLLSYYFEELSNFPLLTKEQEKEFFKKYNETDDSIKKSEIKKILIESNLKLVINIAKQYINKKNSSIFEDLIEEGNIGLLVAIDKYDYTKNARFATYASYWIKHYIKSYLYKNTTLIKFSDRLFNKYLKYKKMVNKYKKNNEEVDRKKIKEELNIDSYTLSIITSLFNKPTDIEDEIKYRSDKYDNIYTEDKNFENVLKEFIHEQLVSAIKQLDEREQHILDSRYGIFGGDFKSFKEIGKKLEISKQRVSQIEKRALEKLAKILKEEKE